jgi:hypothetical protein
VPIEEEDEDRCVFGGPITQALIPGRSLRVRWLRNRAAIEYSFTPLGDMLEAPVRALYNWTRANYFPYSSRPRGALDFHQNA